MRYTHDHAVLIGVRNDQPPLDKSVQLSEHCLRQPIPDDPPPGGTTLLIHRDQPQQSRNNLLMTSAADSARRIQCRICLTSQSTLHLSNLLITLGGQVTTAADPLSQLS
jgi:hypothetical protein